MSDFRPIPFSHEGASYEVRVSINNNVVVVRAYRDDTPANGYSYQIDLDKAHDIAELIGVSAVKNLVRVAIDDVKSGTWTTLQRELGGMQ